MANRYWVGGTGTWQASNTASWSATSGGSGGASVPTSSDNAFFNGSSGGGTVSIGDIGSGVQCANLDFTGFTGTLNSSSSTVSPGGNITFGSGMSFSGSGYLFLQIQGAGGTLTSNGKTIPFGVFVDAGTAVTLGDAFLSTARLQVSGTFNAANFNVTAHEVDATYASATLSMGSGTWEVTGYGDAWYVSGATITPSTSTIKMTNTSSAHKKFRGGGKTYNNVWFVGGGTGQFQITGSNTFNDFKFTSPPGTVKFTAGTTTTVTTFTVSGSDGGVNPDNIVTLDSLTASAHTLTKAGGGTIDCDYISVSNSTATPASTWYAGANSTSVSNNTGWTFSTSSATQSGSALFFGGGI